MKRTNRTTRAAMPSPSATVGKIMLAALEIGDSAAG
jgi:hypothetical protein